MNQTKVLLLRSCPMAFLFAVFFASTLFFANHVLALDTGAPSTNDNSDPMTVEGSSSVLEWQPGMGGDLKFNLKLPKEYHAYEEQFRIEIVKPEGFKIGKIKLKPVREFYDKTSKAVRKGIEDTATLTVAVEAPNQIRSSTENIQIEFKYQACTSTFCLFPTTKTLMLPAHFPTNELKTAEPEIALPKDEPNWFQKLSSGRSIAEILRDNSILAFLFAFLGGILTSFTPCIFPMIPITLAVLGKGSENRSRRQNFLLSVFYVLGIAITYAIMGFIAASTGTVFGASLGNPIILGFICLVFFAMSLSMYGLFEIQLPATFRETLHSTKTGEGYVGALITGAITGLVASPCVGPILVSILAFVATTQNKIYGTSLLFTYALGIGFIFLLLGAFTELTRKLPRSGKWMDGVKFVFGTMMLTAFFYYFQMLVSSQVFDAGLGLALIVLAASYGAFQGQLKTSFERIRKGLMLGVLVVGIGFFAMGSLNLRSQFFNSSTHSHDGLAWTTYSEEVLYNAAKNKKPVIVDFGADWCAACLELEEKTFTNANVKELSQEFVLLHFDATKDSAELRTLKLKYGIQGLPTILFFDQNGLRIESLTLTEFEGPEKFLARMKKATALE